ncbi:MAG: GYD domain-containing protein [Geobacter sp.]|nr:MAG: GYD domain-containing protein [Geobacter sp.]
MPAYLSLINWTEQGVKNVRETVNRGKAVEQAVEKVNGRKIGLWWTMGQYDAIFLFEAPDDETASRMLLATALQGNVRSSTMRCFSEEEMTRIIQGLPS